MTYLAAPSESTVAHQLVPCFASPPSHSVASKDQYLCVELGERGETEDAISWPLVCAHFSVNGFC